MVAEAAKVVFPGWAWVLTLIVPPAGVLLSTYLASQPARRVSKAERDIKLLASFIDLMSRAHARADRVIGIGEQNAAIVAVREMGERHDVLLGPALAGLRTMNRHYSEEQKEVLDVLPEAVRALEKLERRT
jgi:hypothetical protein